MGDQVRQKWHSFGGRKKISFRGTEQKTAVQSGFREGMGVEVRGVKVNICDRSVTADFRGIRGALRRLRRSLVSRILLGQFIMFHFRWGPEWREEGSNLPVDVRTDSVRLFAGGEWNSEWQNPTHTRARRQSQATGQFEQKLSWMTSPG